MIVYEAAKLHPRFFFHLSGSVLPFSFAVALPCGLFAAALKWATELYINGDEWSWLGLDRGTGAVEGVAFSGFNFLIGFLVVFRAQEAYSRFWEGGSRILAMQGEWFDAASSLCAFCRMSSVGKVQVHSFQHTLVRLLSLLHAAVLTELCAGTERDTGLFTLERAFELELIDIEGLNSTTLKTFNESNTKVELVFQWIQQLVVESNQRSVFSVAPPILSRSFQELANGMVEYHQASKIARIPLPFPYVQATEVLLVWHWILTPVLLSMWTGSPLWAFLLTFVQVTFFWSLNSIASELENPFGNFVNNLPAAEMQKEFNERLLLLVSVSANSTPRLSSVARNELKCTSDGTTMGQPKPTRMLNRSATLSAAGLKSQLAPPRRRSRIENEATRKSLGDFFGSVDLSKFVSEASNRSESGRKRSFEDLGEAMKDKSLESVLEDVEQAAPKPPTIEPQTVQPHEDKSSSSSEPSSPRTPQQPLARQPSPCMISGQLVLICEEIRDLIRQCGGPLCGGPGSVSSAPVLPLLRQFGDQDRFNTLLGHGSHASERRSWSKGPLLQGDLVCSDEAEAFQCMIEEARPETIPRQSQSALVP